jgi:hypothetical protein
VLLMPFFPRGTVRVVLTWGERPRDLDGHLYGPLPSGSGFHVDFEHKDADGVHLDVDAKKGFGPETITAKAIPGTYRYSVADSANLETSNGQALGRSGAQIQVYYKEARSDQLHVIPIQVPVNARGPVWHAFDIVVSKGGQIKIAPKDPKAKGTWGSELPSSPDKEKTETSRT